MIVIDQGMNMLNVSLLKGADSADSSDVVPQSSDNMSGSSLEEVLRAETENRAWSKTRRNVARALLNRPMQSVLKSTQCFADRRTRMRLSASGKKPF